ncbi:family 20 glycosylhydrolase [Pedobacter sp. MC2016-24]|uniref:glycoside hydrolase family 20 zincin-like fold domain-containing protein n=1 Tax=Pedobacter sp. MC2016-24 TaxID=2780090 RepID=UPI00187DFF9A|nr:family 20 glycosylhydrolase [Pedobacter sp. MC2016-24]MBE9598048.1 family 20 glycosylhydrolase [Pedobacter sp. MC2016-24]
MIKGLHIWLLFLLSGTALFAVADVPVLPYPQQVKEGKTIAAFSKNWVLKAGGIDLLTLKRLGAVTKHSLLRKKTGLSQLLTLSLTGKNKQIDQMIGQYVQQFDQKNWAEQIGKEGYVLILNQKDQLLVANTERGLFYGLQSLRQLMDAGWKREVYIVDWPSLAHRVVFDDISRGPISKVSYIKEQIQRMASLKVNGLSFYMEHVVQTKAYPDFAPADGKLTIADIKALSAYAKQYHMELIGSFQSFGHFNNILSLPQYQSMGETSTMISPLDPKARHFLESVITEMCGAFSSNYFNVNCDETFDLGKGKSKKYVDSVGIAKYYADHLKFLYEVLKKNGKQLMMWGDIALQHEEILDLLPKDITYMTWEYGDPATYDKWIDPFVKRQLQFMVCPGILNTNRLFPDLAIAKANINGFIHAGYEKGTIGAYTTIWDEGGDQLFSQDWYGVYLAAEKSWNVTSNLDHGFDTRYESVAYGTANGAYVSAINALMKLRDLPLTYNMNHEIWWQHILPQNGETLILNNKDVAAGLKIIDAADELLMAAGPKRHQTDLATLKYIVDRYRLLFDTRTEIAELSGWYQGGTKKSSENVKSKITALQKLKSRYVAMEADFKYKWNRENQPYTLNYALKPYQNRIASLTDLEKKLSGLPPNAVNANWPTATAIGLNVVELDRYYFNYWLLSGPFVNPNHGFPAFLYSEDPDANRPPKPGDFAQFVNKPFRWMKYNTDNGGIINKFKALPADRYVYAFCSVTAEKAMEIPAWIGTDAELELFCNDTSIANALPAQVHAPPSALLPAEKSYNLPLKKGINYILLKIRSNGTNAAFTFRLNTTEPVTNHKHKYTINANQNNHEAD